MNYCKRKNEPTDTVDVVDVIKPIYNFKAKTPEKPDWKALKHKQIKED